MKIVICDGDCGEYKLYPAEAAEQNKWMRPYIFEVDEDMALYWLNLQDEYDSMQNQIWEMKLR